MKGWFYEKNSFHDDVLMDVISVWPGFLQLSGVIDDVYKPFSIRDIDFRSVVIIYLGCDDEQFAILVRELIIILDLASDDDLLRGTSLYPRL